MRFAAAPPAFGREAVRDRHRRDRAAASPLRTRYPQLASLQLDFDFSDRTEYLPSPQVTVFHPPAPAYFCFACPYSDCDGEFNLTRTVDVMMSSGEPRAQGQLRCAGSRHRGTSCTLCLEFSLAAHWY